MGGKSPIRLADEAIRSLEPLTKAHVRRDYQASARRAIKAIGVLLGARNNTEIRRQILAREIADRAADRPTLVYRVKKTGAIRWQRADTPSAVRLSAEQIIGTFDHGADWRDILEAIKA